MGVKVTIELPDELVEAQNKGLPLATDRIITLTKKELEHIQAAKSLMEIARQLQGSMSQEEVEAELAAAREERIAGDTQSGKS